MKRMFSNLAILAFGLLFIARPASAIVYGQLDDFEDRHDHGLGEVISLKRKHRWPGWSWRSLIFEAIADGGLGGRLTAFNLQQWLGNYVAQGVTAIEIDL